MERSSPLAAMHRPSVAFGRRDVFHRDSQAAEPLGKPRGLGDFSFREQFRSRPDYFSVRPVHGSSPAGSLAADLCQNFRIGDDTRSVVPSGEARQASNRPC